MHGQLHDRLSNARRSELTWTAAGVITNLASSDGTSCTSSSKYPSSLIASSEGGCTRMAGSRGMGGTSGLAVAEFELATVVA